ncbi:DUF2384 domain-containing protein [Variovorax sp. J22P240]|uniref:antitoxin Xre/MbcA/ParS toxin-binding domain-containing protein n=1 Tax=Variovorax sp. J22P240 TaxID=3053514 RepID=UPI00257623C7|nr:antitoxin Xre/MbcA/ParS toxin-binding domain-containing protein [Variovorax sp. J22P240]MDM0001070.1 DUF2384 domain-containing protein [Variovorax sp. J22P240]
MVILSISLEKVSNGIRNGAPTGPVGHPLRCSFVDRVQESQRDVAFIALLDAYRATGGLLRWHDLAQLQSGRGTGDHASLSRSIASGEILCFEWNQSVWVPAFQLDRRGLGARTETRRVLAELSGVFDGWSATQWFVAPNAWLGDRIPLERMDTHLDAVLDAARADRFAAMG